MAVRVRPLAGSNELRTAIDLVCEAWRVAYADIVPESAMPVAGDVDDVELRERTRRYATRDDEAYLVAVEGNRIVGLAYAIWNPKDTRSFVAADDAELRSIYVSPDRWGEGTGSRLLAAVVDALPPTVGGLTLETFRENDPARGFYEARGFEPVAESAFDVGDDEPALPTTVYRRPA